MLPTSGSDLSGILPEVSDIAQRVPALKPDNHSSFLFLLEWFGTLDRPEAVPDSPVPD